MTRQLLICKDCRTDNTQCVECGQWTDGCECAEITEIYCTNCSVVFYYDEEEADWLEDDDFYADCTCDTRFTTSLICDNCGVYRASIEQPWIAKSFGDKPECECIPVKEYNCNDCGVRKNLETNEWEYIPGSKIHHIVKCRHYDVELKFPNEVSVYASSRFTRGHSEDTPDFGVYLDSYWQASCPAYLIDWDDYGLPTRWDVAAHCIIDAYKKAENGLWVEVGCLGGHGRTGVALAMMGVLAGLKPEDAIQYVRDHYCNQSIETDEQEWFVEWFDKYVNGGTMKIKTSTILGKACTPDDEHEFQYESITDWRTRDVITASGKRPKSITEISKSKFVITPKDEEITEPHQIIVGYCDVCDMAEPCFCGSDSPELARQVERLVEGAQAKHAVNKSKAVETANAILEDLKVRA